jgi:hypothetical protein
MTTDDQQNDDPDPGWALGAMSAIEAMARTGARFTAFDVKERFQLPEPAHHSEWGRLFAAAHAAGVIEHAGATTSRRRTTAASLVRVWRGAPDWITTDTAAAA